MTAQKKTRRGATGGHPENVLLGGIDGNQNSASTTEYQAKHVMRRARVPAATARTIARLAFEQGRAMQ